MADQPAGYARLIELSSGLEVSAQMLDDSDERLIAIKILKSARKRWKCEGGYDNAHDKCEFWEGLLQAQERDMMVAMERSIVFTEPSSFSRILNRS